VNAFGTHLRDADLSLACRDEALPCLADVLDDDRLSGLLGESIHVTRVRYKPHTSALVAFCSTRNGKEDYGWALTRSRTGFAGLAERERASKARGGGIRLIRPAPERWEAAVAVGSVEDDWALRKNLRWLGNRGVDRLGILHPSGSGPLTGNARIIRYKPERRVVLMDRTKEGAIVIKAAARPTNREQERNFRNLLLEHGVPVLCPLGGESSARHGISATPAWGDGDLAAATNAPAARSAGEALARLHSIPVPAEADPAALLGRLWRQLTATSTMVGALLPALEDPAAKVGARIFSELAQLSAHGSHSLVHGDFSADQVLVNGPDVRLIDFDRTHLGAAEADLGSFTAVEEIGRWKQARNPTNVSSTEHLMDGYTRAGGRFSTRAVDAWAAFRFFSCSVDPFRDRAPDWAADIFRHLDKASELIP
jgi:Ser/Thr protein kinase RdoA (MazF antagonist)